jgi:hypothetical protein
VPTGPLSAKIGTTIRSAVLTSAIAGLAPGGSRWIYGAIIAADTRAVSLAVTGRNNRLVVITTGQDSTPNTPRSAVINAARAGSANLQVDVVGVGPTVPATAYSQIAKAGGGTYIPVPDPTKLTQALTDLLSPAPTG